MWIHLSAGHIAQGEVVQQVPARGQTLRQGVHGIGQCTSFAASPVRERCIFPLDRKTTAMVRFGHQEHIDQFVKGAGDRGKTDEQVDPFLVPSEFAQVGQHFIVAHDTFY